MNPDTCGRANSIWIRTRVEVEIFAESAKKNLRIQKISGYVWTGAKGTIALPFRKSLRTSLVRQCKEICQKVRCTFRVFFCLSIKPVACFFLFSRYLRRHCGCSSSLVALPCKTTFDMRRFRWKADDLMGKGRRKRRPQLLANREARIRKQLNLLSWMLATILTKYCGSFAFKNPPSELELCV